MLSRFSLHRLRKFVLGSGCQEQEDHNQFKSSGDLQFHGSLLPLAQPRTFAAWLRVLFRHDWVVYSKQPFGGPEHVLRYLGAYTHRVAISNSRLVALSERNVTFRWRDSAQGNKKRLMTLAVEEFLRRFLLHLLPPGFVRIRNFGFLANRNRATLLPLCFQLLSGSDQRAVSPASQSTKRPPHSGTAQSAVEPCTSSSGSPPPNSFSTHHLNRTGVKHEPLFPSSDFARASARTQIPCLIRPRTCCLRFLQPLPDASAPYSAAPSGPQSRRSYPSPQFPYTSAPIKPIQST